MVVGLQGASFCIFPWVFLVPVTLNIAEKNLGAAGSTND